MQRRNRCMLQNEQMSTCRSSETKLRETGGYQPYKIPAPREEQFQFFATQQIQEIYQKIASHLLCLFERKRQASTTVNHSTAEQRSMHLRPECPKYGHYSTYSYPRKGLTGSIFQPLPCDIT